MGQRGVRGQGYGPPRKDRQGAQDVRGEILEEIRGGAVAPVSRNPNRDVGRGDWDRTGRHHDEDVGRDDGLEPPPPEELYSPEESDDNR